MNYEQFIQSKQKTLAQSGFEVDETNLNPALFDFQKWIVRRALSAGKYAIFADCGLGKTLMQLEWARQVALKTQKPVLILCPLAVSGQTIHEGVKFGYDVVNLFRNYRLSNDAIYIANYEQLPNIVAANFAGIVLDESSILKNYEGATKNEVVSMFSDTPYKLACTATPSPNDPMELGNHSEFLNVMSRNQMLAMYFVHDGGETAKWRIKGHAEKAFWQFVGTWAVMLAKPCDIGFSAVGYDLPPLNFHEMQVKTPSRQNGQLFNETAVSATDFNAELRLTKLERLSSVVELVNGKPNEPFIIWIRQNEEGDYLRREIPDAIEVKGSDTPDEKESRLLGFANGEFRVLITKPKIAMFGMNFQNCPNQVHASLDFSFEGLYQSIRRSYRFGQKNEVNIYLVTTDTMQNVVESINRKQKQFEKMQAEMTAATNEHLSGSLLEAHQYDTETVKNEKYEIRRGDCVRLIANVPDESVGLTVFSPPFADLYTYSSHVEDMGNATDYEQFCQQFAFLVRELFRVTKSGRNVAVHCMDLPIQKGKEGVIALRDFSGIILKMFADAGFIYHSRVTIWKNPVTEMQRTKALGLLHKQLGKDATMSRVGIPDYVLVFRKDGERSDPVRCNIPVDVWQRYASPVWMDIDYSDTLNREAARDEQDEKHICPLQLPTIERLIHLYSNEGDLVLDPFGGIGSTGYKAIELGRRALMFELKESYFSAMKNNIAAICELKKQMSLF